MALSAYLARGLALALTHGADVRAAVASADPVRGAAVGRRLAGVVGAQRALSLMGEPHASVLRLAYGPDGEALTDAGRLPFCRWQAVLPMVPGACEVVGQWADAQPEPVPVASRFTAWVAAHLALPKGERPEAFERVKADAWALLSKVELFYVAAYQR